MFEKYRILTVRLNIMHKIKIKNKNLKNIIKSHFLSLIRPDILKVFNATNSHDLANGKNVIKSMIHCALDN